MTEELKPCRRCGRYLPLSQFHQRNDGTRRARCRACENSVRRDRANGARMLRVAGWRSAGEALLRGGLTEPVMGVIRRTPQPEGVKLGRPFQDYMTDYHAGVTGNRDRWGIEFTHPFDGEKVFVPIATDEVLGRDYWDINKNGMVKEGWEPKTWYKTNRLVLNVWKDRKDGEVVYIGPEVVACGCKDPECDDIRENPDVWTYGVLGPSLDEFLKEDKKAMDELMEEVASRG